MRHVLPGETVTDKLGTIRQSLRETSYDQYDKDDEEESGRDHGREYVERFEEKEDRWDCETILSGFLDLLSSVDVPLIS